MIDARETPPGVAPVVTTLPKPFPKDGYRFFDEKYASEAFRDIDKLVMSARYAAQVRLKPSEFFFPGGIS
jgi:hypothetical protein